jgi:hypothetical protein
MPYLLCEQHGHSREAMFAREQDDYRQAGESVLVVKGTLISGPWQCDRCNVKLTRGHKACMATAFARHYTGGTQDYDFAPEKRYFDMTRAQVAVYGVQWPSLARVSW